MTDQELEELLNMTVPSDKDVEAAGKRFDRRIRRMIWRRRMIGISVSVAAIVTLGIVVTLLWPKEDKKNAVKMAKIETPVIVPTLVLPNGNSVNLIEQEIDDISPVFKVQETGESACDTIPENREIEYNTLVIPAGYTYGITLADGTRVLLNAGSRLKYPVEFLGDSREVKLTGEAYFDVAKSRLPFVVNIDSSKIRVYGTRFNVKGRHQGTVETVLVEGKIGFTPPNREEIKVESGELVFYDTEVDRVETKKVDTGYAIAWMNGVFKYRDKPLNLVLEDISTWYGVQFDEQVNLKKIEITMSLSKETPIDEVISFLERITDCKFIKERGYYTVK